ncbi:hypothetical protein BGZ82_007227 [Podila clonocystis]|nr:hypothetical protein BGZ82_007227 [Podila clonocystis]
MIVGGVMLARLLHKAEIPFTLFDRAKVVKSLGSSWAFLEFKAIGKPSGLLHIFNDDLQPQFVMDFTERTAL